MYDYIIDPVTGNKELISGKEGKILLQRYLHFLKGGASASSDYSFTKPFNDISEIPIPKSGQRLDIAKKLAEFDLANRDPLTDKLIRKHGSYIDLLLRCSRTRRSMQMLTLNRSLHPALNSIGGGERMIFNKFPPGTTLPEDDSLPIHLRKMLEWRNSIILQIEEIDIKIRVPDRSRRSWNHKTGIEIEKKMAEVVNALGIPRVPISTIHDEPDYQIPPDIIFSKEILRRLLSMKDTEKTTEVVKKMWESKTFIQRLEPRGVSRSGIAHATIYDRYRNLKAMLIDLNIDYAMLDNDIPHIKALNNIPHSELFLFRPTVKSIHTDTPELLDEGDIGEDEFEALLNGADEVLR
tara:strand:+ start:855 stop:1907 length:1053 start_codon:yes stop_codon:yes gene_type:complete